MEREQTCVSAIRAILAENDWIDTRAIVKLAPVRYTANTVINTLQQLRRSNEAHTRPARSVNPDAHQKAVQWHRGPSPAAAEARAPERELERSPQLDRTPRRSNESLVPDFLRDSPVFARTGGA